MKRPLLVMLTFGIVPIAMLLSCTTVNRFDRYNVENTRLAANLQVPPEPTLNITYSVHYRSDDPIFNAMSLGTNIAKAASASQAEAKMRTALAAVDVPQIVLREAFDASAGALDAQKESSTRQADYLLDLEIRNYGISATSYGPVYLHMDVKARIYQTKSNDLVWRRAISVNHRASPTMFGFGHIVGNVVTAGVLANLTTEQLQTGFEQLAGESARAVARRLEKDLRKARYGR